MVKVLVTSREKLVFTDDSHTAPPLKSIKSSLSAYTVDMVLEPLGRDHALQFLSEVV